MVPIFYMRDHRRGNDDRQRWLVNPWNDDGTLVNLDKYPRLKTYLETNKERLSRRYVAKKNKTAWYRTIDKLTPGLLDRDLLLMPDMAAQPDPILSHGKYPHHNCYWITSDEWDWRFSAACLWPIRHVVSSMRLVSRCVEERCAFRHSTCAWCICRNISK